MTPAHAIEGGRPTGRVLRRSCDSVGSLACAGSAAGGEPRARGRVRAVAVRFPHVTNVWPGKPPSRHWGGGRAQSLSASGLGAKPSGETRSDPLLPATWPQIDALSLPRIRAAPDVENALAVPLTSTHPVATPDRPCQRNAARPSVPGAAYASYERLGFEQWPLRAESHYRRAVVHMVRTERGGGRWGTDSNNPRSRALPRSLP